MIKKDFFNKDCSKLKNKKLYLLDMDGTIYLDNDLFDGVKELLKKIEDNGGKYVFITNNSSRSVSDYVKKLHNLGLNQVDKNMFFTSTQASKLLFKEKFSDGLIYAQGTHSFIKELKDFGLNITEIYDEKAVAVLVGNDNELTSEKLKNTCKMLTKSDIPYYATNPDWVCPVDFGYVPDCGSICFMIEKATGKAPIYIGKPQPEMIYLAMQKFGSKKEQTVVIGDRIYTDIASGYNAGVDTILVLSGEATIDDYNQSQIKPTFVLNHIKELLDINK